MSPVRKRLLVLITALVMVLVAVIPASAASGTARGPSTVTDPYILPVAPGVKITSLLTVADSGAAANGYELVGIPDGIGVARDGNRAIVYMNHELRDTQGIARRHGQPGAFASRLEINRRSLAVTSGSDLVDPGVQFWDYPSGTYVTSGARFADSAFQELTFGRWCSSTLSDPGLFYSESRRAGYRGQIYFGNEEDGDIGRTFGILTDGTDQGTASARPLPVGEHDPSRQSVPHDGGDGSGGRPGWPRQPALDLRRHEAEHRRRVRPSRAHAMASTSCSMP